jgi:hypothetical protein
MRFPRIKLSSVGFAVFVLALNFAVVRAAFFGPGPNYWAVFVMFLLPMLDTFAIVLYRMRGPGHRTAGALGFVVTGAAATLAVFSACLLSPVAAINGFNVVGRPIALVILKAWFRLFGNGGTPGGAAPFLLVLAFEILLPPALFCLPVLLVALAGGWVGRQVPGQGSRSLAPRP